MPLTDLWSLLLETLRAQRLRTLLTILGIVLGMGAVVLLSSIGEGTRVRILDQFSQFGTTILGVQPGKVKTFGMGPGAIGGTSRPLTVDDATALKRVPGVVHVAPHVMGAGEVEADQGVRRTYVYGTVAEDAEILRWRARLGTYLPAGDPEAIPPVCVLGPRVADDLFPRQSPLGARVRIGGARFTVVGVMERKGQILGFDFDDMVIIPVARALRLFNRQDVNEIHILASSRAMMPAVREGVERVLRERHGGEDDVTLVDQADMLELVDQVLRVMTWGVIAIAAIALGVGAMGILTILWVGVQQRGPEIGLMKAVGASDGQVRLVFLSEAGLLSLLGGGIGVAAGAATAWLLESLAGIPARTPAWSIPLALGVSLAVGLAAGVIPALRAARLDPIEALRSE